MTTPEISTFELAAGELARLGIALTRLPGEYRVNYRNAGDATARSVHSLDLALAIGRVMAADRPPPAPVRRRYRPRTAKAYNRHLRRRHMRRLRARGKKASPSPSRITR